MVPLIGFTELQASRCVAASIKRACYVERRALQYGPESFSEIYSYTVYILAIVGRIDRVRR